jgi:hypothetical protein
MSISGKILSLTVILSAATLSDGIASDLLAGVSDSARTRTIHGPSVDCAPADADSANSAPTSNDGRKARIYRTPE